MCSSSYRSKNHQSLSLHEINKSSKTSDPNRYFCVHFVWKSPYLFDKERENEPPLFGIQFISSCDLLGKQSPKFSPLQEDLLCWLCYTLFHQKCWLRLQVQNSHKRNHKTYMKGQVKTSIILISKFCFLQPWANEACWSVVKTYVKIKKLKLVLHVQKCQIDGNKPKSNTVYGGGGISV